jgi:hypothetical protein
VSSTAPAGIAGGGGLPIFLQGADRVRSAWGKAGKQGSPRLASLAYYALGPDAESLAESYLRDYYGFLGDYAANVVAGALTTEAAIRETVRQFGEAGCDELILFPCSADPDQLRRLTDVTQN